jgi:hypothetical protein
MVHTLVLRGHDGTRSRAAMCPDAGRSILSCVPAAPGRRGRSLIPLVGGVTGWPIRCLRTR